MPSLAGLRGNLIGRLGENGYKGLFSVLSLAGLVLIVLGKSRAEFQHIYTPLPWGRDLALVVMPFSFMLLAAANMPSNIKRFTRHPMLWGE